MSETAKLEFITLPPGMDGAAHHVGHDKRTGRSKSREPLPQAAFDERRIVWEFRKFERMEFDRGGMDWGDPGAAQELANGLHAQDVARRLNSAYAFDFDYTPREHDMLCIWLEYVIPDSKCPFPRPSISAYLSLIHKGGSWGINSGYEHVNIHWQPFQRGVILQAGQTDFLYKLPPPDDWNSDALIQWTGDGGNHLTLDERYLLAYRRFDGHTYRLLSVDLFIDYQYRYILALKAHNHKRLTRNQSDSFVERGTLNDEMILFIESLWEADYARLKRNYLIEGLVISGIGSQQFFINFGTHTIHVDIEGFPDHHLPSSEAERILFAFNESLIAWVEARYKAWLKP